MTEKPSESFASTQHTEESLLLPEYETFHPEKLRAIIEAAGYQKPETTLEHDPRFDYFESVTITNNVEKTVDTYKIEKVGQKRWFVWMLKVFSRHAAENEQPRRIERIIYSPEGRYEIFVEGKVGSNGVLIPQTAGLLKGSQNKETSLVVEADASRQEVTGIQKIESLDQRNIKVVFSEEKAPSSENAKEVDRLAVQLSENFTVNPQIENKVGQVFLSVNKDLHPRMTAEELLKNPL